MLRLMLLLLFRYTEAAGEVKEAHAARACAMAKVRLRAVYSGRESRDRECALRRSRCSRALVLTWIAAAGRYTVGETRERLQRFDEAGQNMFPQSSSWA